MALRDWLLPKFAPQDNTHPSGPNLDADPHGAAYHRHFKQGSLPDPGASIYGYDTLQLLPMYPIDRFDQPGQLNIVTGPQLYVLPAAFPYGLYPPIGQIISQPLYDPDAIPGSE